MGRMPEYLNEAKKKPKTKKDKKSKFKRVMKEFGKGDLKPYHAKKTLKNKKQGGTKKAHKQALAIAFSEAGMTKESLNEFIDKTTRLPSQINITSSTSIMGWPIDYTYKLNNFEYDVIDDTGVDYVLPDRYDITDWTPKYVQLDGKTPWVVDREDLEEFVLDEDRSVGIGGGTMGGVGTTGILQTPQTNTILRKEKEKKENEEEIDDDEFEEWVNIPESLNEGNLNPYDKIGKMIAKEMGVDLAFEQGKDGLTVKQKDLTKIKIKKKKYGRKYESQTKKVQNIYLVKETLDPTEFTRGEKPYKALNIGKDRKRELDFDTIKDFKDVEIGDIALDYSNYNSSDNSVLAKGIGIDSFLKYGKKYDDSGVMHNFFDEAMENYDYNNIDDIKWIAINYPGSKDSAVWVYEFDGGWVPKYIN